MGNSTPQDRDNIWDGLVHALTNSRMIKIMEEAGISEERRNALLRHAQEESAAATLRQEAEEEDKEERITLAEIVELRMENNSLRAQIVDLRRNLDNANTTYLARQRALSGEPLPVPVDAPSIALHFADALSSIKTRVSRYSEMEQRIQRLENIVALTERDKK